MSGLTLVEQIHELVKQRNEQFVGHRNTFLCRKEERECFERKHESLANRNAEIVKSMVIGDVIRSQQYKNTIKIDYVTHYEQLIRQKRKLYLEEMVQLRRATFQNNKLADDVKLIYKSSQEHRGTGTPEPWFEPRQIEVGRGAYSNYDRREAVRYAERWWNNYNPEYKKFTDNCTNFISQCLRAGGAQMSGFPNRSKGWWYRSDNWSYSWAVAHSFRWLLSGAQQGLRGEERSSAMELEPGDVICYDFDGDGRWQHSTIVVAKDANGEPLVNAQTSNSRMRYWKYEDSTAWTPNIKYKFFHIVN